MPLKDLNLIAESSRNNYSSYNQEEIELSSGFKKLFSQIIQNDSKEKKVSFSKYTTIVHSSKEQTITFPNQWFYIASYFVDYLIELKKYKAHFKEIFKHNSDLKNTISRLKKESTITGDVATQIENHFEEDDDSTFFKKFLSDYDWWYGSKTIDRNDYYVSPILSLSNVINVSQTYIADLTYFMSRFPNLVTLLDESKISNHKPIGYDEKIEDTNLTILLEDKQLRNIIFNTFKYLLNEFDESIVLPNYSLKESSIENRSYSGLTIPKFFNFEVLLGLFDTSQSASELKSSNTSRFINENLKVLNSENAYFTSQWNESNNRGLSLGNFNKYLSEVSDNTLEILRKGEKFLLYKKDKLTFLNFQKYCKLSGLIYSEELITRYISSLVTKPFVLLSGLSGSGKTKLAQSFAQWICESKEQYCIVPVGADWTNREPLLGYVNALEPEKYILPENGALELIIKANKDKDKPYFLILDEMNLSHVERYFADFLSVMESDDSFKLHSSDDELETTSDITVPSTISWPKNLLVVGTVNIDETTYMFSPKVLDRANVIEFRVTQDDLGKYFGSITPFDMTKLCKDDSDQGLGASMGHDLVKKAKEPATTNIPALNDELKRFFGELQDIGAEFGYRTASEIQTLFAKIDAINPDYESAVDKKIDIAIMQKLLPKLHGSRNKLSDILKTLATLCFEKGKLSDDEQKTIFELDNEDNLRFPISYGKLKRMHKNVVQNGFTSYAEA